MELPDLNDLRRCIRVTHAFVFGSASRDEEADDLDLLVVSDSFAGMTWAKRREIVQRYVDCPGLDPLCLTVSEFGWMRRGSSPFSATVLASMTPVDET